MRTPGTPRHPGPDSVHDKCVVGGSGDDKRLDCIQWLDQGLRRDPSSCWRQSTAILLAHLSRSRLKYVPRECPFLSLYNDGIENLRRGRKLRILLQERTQFGEGMREA
jgi:hypothetical protein